MGLTPVEKAKYEDKFEKFSSSLSENALTFFRTPEDGDKAQRRDHYPPGAPKNPSAKQRLYEREMADAEQEIKFGLTASTNFPDEQEIPPAQPTPKRKTVAGTNLNQPQYKPPSTRSKLRRNIPKEKSSEEVQQLSDRQVRRIINKKHKP